jgi:hypothetical protein
LIICAPCIVRRQSMYIVDASGKFETRRKLHGTMADRPGGTTEVRWEAQGRRR